MNNDIKKVLLFDWKQINTIYRKTIKLTPEATWVFLGQAGTAVAGLLGIKLLTHFLEPSEFGKLALANTIIALIGTNFFGPFGQGLSRFWAISRERGSLDVFYAVSNRLIKYISLAAILTTIISALILTTLKDINWTVLIILSSVIGIISGIYSLRVGIFTAARYRKRTAFLEIINTLLKPLIATVLIILTISNVNITLLGYLLAALLTVFIVEYLYIKTVYNTSSYRSESYPNNSLSQGLGKEILSFSWPFLVWGIFGWIHMSCDRWALQTFYGSEVLGAFAVVSQLAIYPLAFGSGFLSTLFMPIVFQKAGDLSQANLKAANRILFVMMSLYIVGAIVLVGLFSISHQFLVLLISNNRFVKYSYLLPLLTLSWAFFYLGQVLVSFGLLANRSANYILPKVVVSIIALFTTFYFSANIGPIGVAIGLLVSGIIYSLWCGLIALRIIRFKYC